MQVELSKLRQRIQILEQKESETQYKLQQLIEKFDALDELVKKAKENGRMLRPVSDIMPMSKQQMRADEK